MTQVMHSQRNPVVMSALVTGAAIHVAVLLCWGGIIPIWRLAPGPVQSSLEAALDSLRGPALAMAGAVVLVALFRLAGMRGRLSRLVHICLSVGGIAFAIVALAAVAGISFAGYGPGWTLLGLMLHVGAIVAAVILPWVAVIVVIAGLFSLLRPEPRIA